MEVWKDYRNRDILRIKIILRLYKRRIAVFMME